MATKEGGKQFLARVNFWTAKVFANACMTVILNHLCFLNVQLR
jgi:hypothetical protein